MKKTTRILGIILAVVLTLALFAPVAFAEPTEEPTAVPTEEPTVAPTEEPTVAPTQAPTQTPKPTQTLKPTQEPTQAPTQAPTQTPAPTVSEDPGVNITIYVYTQDGKAASGYQVKIDNSSQDTNKDGMVSFPGVDISDHDLSIKGPDGKTSTGRLYLERGSSTGIVDMTMGGKYEISVANGTNNLYLSAVYVPEQALQVTAAGENKQPAPSPMATASGAATGLLNITSAFLDADGKGISGVTVQVSQPEGAEVTPMVGTTDSKGLFVWNGAHFGTYAWSILAPGAAAEKATALNIEIRQGTTTRIAETIDGGYVVETPSTSSQLYFEFKQAGDTFILSSVADKAPGGIDSMMLGIIVIVVIVVVLIIVLAAVRHNKKKKTMMNQKQKEFRGREKEFEEDRSAFTAPKAPEEPRKTGGTNKMGDRNKF